jgi:hypothetical protein
LAHIFRKVFYFNDFTLAKTDEKKFWKFFFSKIGTHVIHCIVHKCNISYFNDISTVNVLLQQGYANNDDHQYQGIVVQINIWGAFSILCMAYFVVFHFKLNTSIDIWSLTVTKFGRI